MTFTALEALLLAAFVSCIIGLAVRVRCVSPKECEERRRITDEAFLRLANAVETMKISNDIQFRMLRAIVTHLDLPAREKADILNMGLTD